MYISIHLNQTSLQTIMCKVKHLFNWRRVHWSGEETVSTYLTFFDSKHVDGERMRNFHPQTIYLKSISLRAWPSLAGTSKAMVKGKWSLQAVSKIWTEPGMFECASTIHVIHTETSFARNFHMRTINIVVATSNAKYTSGVILPQPQLFAYNLATSCGVHVQPP